MPRLFICLLQLGDLLGRMQAVNNDADQSTEGLRCISVPGKGGCVMLWEMHVPGQLGWLLEMSSDSVKWFPLSFPFPL